MVREEMARFFDDAIIKKLHCDPWFELVLRCEWDLAMHVRVPIVRALEMSSGLGKTNTAIDLVSEYLKACKINLVHYVVPNYDLAEDILKRAKAAGIDARIFRGMPADDPDNPRRKMCQAPERVKLAVACGSKVADAVCGSLDRDNCCVFLKNGTCSYQIQLKEAVEQPPQMWIIVSNYLFLDMELLGEADLTIIDERFWHRGLFGVNDEIWDTGVELRELQSALLNQFDDTYLWRRNELARLLEGMENGGVKREGLGEINRCWCDVALRYEQEHLKELREQLGLRPGLDRKEFARIAGRAKLIEEVKLTNRVIRLYEQLRSFSMSNPPLPVSGFLELVTVKVKVNKKIKHIRWLLCRGHRQLTKMFRMTPTLILDATRPVRSILKVFFRQVEMPPPIIAIRPEASRLIVHQGAPTSARKLKGPIEADATVVVAAEAGDEKAKRVVADAGLRLERLKDLKLFILRCWYECGQNKVLVIAQKEVEERLALMELPKNIALEHYNNIAGVDVYKDVHVQILIGRPLPGSLSIEQIAGALSGQYYGPDGGYRSGEFVWGYDNAVRLYTLRDGTQVVAIKNFEHPDKLCDAILQQICNAEVLQASERGRSINRTESNRLVTHRLLDEELGDVVDEVVGFQNTSPLIRMLHDDDFILKSAVDLQRVRPDLFPPDVRSRVTRFAEEQGFDELAATLPALTTVRYQVTGSNQKPRSALVKPAKVVELRALLEMKLGGLTFFE